MTSRARFIGDPRHDGDGPGQIECFGLSFIKGEWRDVPQDVFLRCARHSHFEIEVAAVIPPELGPERITDLDEPVKRKPGRPRKDA